MRTTFVNELMKLAEKDERIVLITGDMGFSMFEKFKEKGIEVHFPKMEYCTDNAAMIGCAAYYNLKKSKI